VLEYESFGRSVAQRGPAGDVVNLGFVTPQFESPILDEATKKLWFMVLKLDKFNRGAPVVVICYCEPYTRVP
jgi:hypothetical protein